MTKKKDSKNESQICIVTVTGHDKVGIIARVSSVMADANVNILDVNQKIMQDYFVMTMGCDMAKATASMKMIQQELGRIAKDMSLNITFQNECIFKMMHRI